jgi:hypothetical protein
MKRLFVLALLAPLLAAPAVRGDDLGGNKIRIHHHVVRAMPGGADGKALTEKDGQVKASVDMPELRKTLTSYLDGFVAAKGPFPRNIRPMEMRELRVVALVQDDESHEILQAIQVGVEP